MTWEAQLLHDLTPLLPGMTGRTVHLATLVEPYMGRIESGEKTVESRWGKIRCAPHDRVFAGDVLVFKRTGGPIRGWAVAQNVCTIQGLTPSRVRAVVARMRPHIGVGDNFAATVEGVRYATLIGLGSFHALDAGHIAIGKTDRRGWVVLGRSP